MPPQTSKSSKKQSLKFKFTREVGSILSLFNLDSRRDLLMDAALAYHHKKEPPLEAHSDQMQAIKKLNSHSIKIGSATDGYNFLYRIASLLDIRFKEPLPKNQRSSFQDRKNNDISIGKVLSFIATKAFSQYGNAISDHLRSASPRYSFLTSKQSPETPPLNTFSELLRPFSPTSNPGNQWPPTPISETQHNVTLQTPKPQISYFSHTQPISRQVSPARANNEESRSSSNSRV